MINEKKYYCKKCHKEYCHYGWVERHFQKTGHQKFKRINEGEFKIGGY